MPNVITLNGILAINLAATLNSLDQYGGTQYPGYYTNGSNLYFGGITWTIVLYKTGF